MSFTGIGIFGYLRLLATTSAFCCISSTVSAQQPKPRKPPSKTLPSVPTPASKRQAQTSLSPQEILEARRTMSRDGTRPRIPGVRSRKNAKVVVRPAPVRRHLFDGITLTDVQEKQLATINASYTPRLAAFARGRQRRKIEGPSPEAAALYQEYTEAVQSVLTPDQQAVLSRNRELAHTRASQAAAKRASLPKGPRPKDSISLTPRRRGRR